MPRASDGTVTLPAGNPFVDGTVISADTMNTTIADLASMIEDSLSRSGYGGMNVPLSFQDGTVSAPGIAFDSDPNTGLYDEAADNPAIAAGGVKSQEWTPTGTTIPGTLAVTGAATVGGALTVTGALTPSGGITGLSKTSLPAVGQQVSNSSGTFNQFASTTETDVTNLTVTMPTLTGRPVFIMLRPDDTSTSGISITAGTVAFATVYFRIYRDATVIYRTTLSPPYVASTTLYLPPSIFTLDTVGSGTNVVYKMTVEVPSIAGGNGVNVTNCRLIAFEL